MHHRLAQSFKSILLENSLRLAKSGREIALGVELVGHEALLGVDLGQIAEAKVADLSHVFSPTVFVVPQGSSQAQSTMPVAPSKHFM